MKRKILVIEDDPVCAKAIDISLGQQFQLIAAPTLEEAKKRISEHSFDLVILDLELPDGDGLTFLSMKKSYLDLSIPIIICTSRSTIDDQIIGITLGAFDYTVKPIMPKLLLAKVNNILKIQKHFVKENKISELDNLSIDFNKYKVYRKNHETGRSEEVSLTPVEFKLLSLFSKSAEKILSRESIIEQIWGSSVFITNRTVDAHISRLRKKINLQNFEIKGHIGLGYSLSKLAKQEKKAI